MKPSAILSLFVLLSLCPYASALSQGSENSEPLRCVSLSRIARTEVINDRTIAFHLRGGEIYLNHLRRECSGLEREGRFSYRSVNSRLCRSDFISVLELSGFGPTRGASCSLDTFMPSDEEEIAVLKGQEEEAEILVEEIDLEE